MIEFIKRAGEKINLFVATSLINSIIQSRNVRFYLSYDIKITLKSHFLHKKRLEFCHYVSNIVMDVIITADNLSNAKPAVQQRHPGD